MAGQPEKITIAGGGLAGLACGIRLRQLGIAVELHERRTYPLKKVCGEFLSPLGWRRCQELGADRHLAFPPRPLGMARFYDSDSSYVDFRLSPPAWGISREALDSALAGRFEELGGTLIQGHALEVADVDARGRPLALGGNAVRWLGWKGYMDPGDIPPGLEKVQMMMLPIRGGYCGLSPIEDGRTSVCLVARAPAIPDELLRSHPLLRDLAPRIRPHASIAGFDFVATAGSNRIGDSRRVWPPLVGDGMSRALGAGIRWAEGHPGGGILEALQFRLSRAAHSLMLTRFSRSLAGPLMRVWPWIPEQFYRFSRG
jgi:hypothetical protein